eukprot:m.1562625 g.1562625  ORF g.1562625 m.1562625 type:complete len:116 (-) comp25281_c0_seq37:114-461(-)
MFLLLQLILIGSVLPRCICVQEIDCSSSVSVTPENADLVQNCSEIDGDLTVTWMTSPGISVAHQTLTFERLRSVSGTLSILVRSDTHSIRFPRLQIAGSISIAVQDVSVSTEIVC